MSQNVACPSATVAASAAIAAARTTSEAIISRLRLTRSAASPAGKVKSQSGSERANATMPAFAGEWVSASTRSGYAICVDCVPKFDRSCPPWNSTKSRFRRRGTADTGRTV